MTKKELLEKLITIEEGERKIFEHMMAIRDEVDLYEKELYKYERALDSIFMDMFGITDLHRDFDCAALLDLLNNE